MAISENIICNPEYTAPDIYTTQAINDILTPRVNTKDDYATWLVTNYHNQYYYNGQLYHSYETVTAQVAS